MAHLKNDDAREGLSPRGRFATLRAQMKTLSLLRSMLALSVALTFCSCASVSVKSSTASGAKPTQPPKRFYVAPFSVARADVRENSMGKTHGKLGSDVQKLVADYLVADLSKNIAPASLAKGGGSGDAWIVSGDFTKVYEGNRLLRMGIGLGAGGTKMETQVAVRNGSAANPPFLKFSTSGGSNAMPGAATNPVPFSSVPSALLQSTMGVTDDAARTARMITATIADYMVQRGWLAAGKVQKPKMAR